MMKENNKKRSIIQTLKMKERKCKSKNAVGLEKYRGWKKLENVVFV